MFGKQPGTTKPKCQCWWRWVAGSDVNKTKFLRPRSRLNFLISDRSCRKTDCLRPHHWWRVAAVVLLWLGSAVVRALDLQSAGRRFTSWPLHCRVATLGKSFTHVGPAPMKLRLQCMAGTIESWFSLSVFNGHLQGGPVLTGTRMSPFWILLEVVSGDNWSCKMCKAPVKINQHPVSLQAGCPSCRPTNSVRALKGKP